MIDRQKGRQTDRHTAITEHKHRRGQRYHGNERLFRSISSSSSILVACALSPSFMAGFLIDDKAIYVSLMFPLASLLFIFLLPHPFLTVSLMLLAIYASSVLFFSLSLLHFLSSLILILRLLSFYSPLCLVRTHISAIFSSSLSPHLHHPSSSSLSLFLSPSYIIFSLNTSPPPSSSLLLLFSILPFSFPMI